MSFVDDSFVRASAKAIIIQEEKLLLIEIDDDNSGVAYMLPGGGRQKDETLAEALVRECIEEIGVTVTVGELQHIREFSYKRYENTGMIPMAEPDTYQIDFIFSCTIPEDVQPKNGLEMDAVQRNVVWVPLKELPNKKLYPKMLEEIGQDKYPLYLGEAY